MHRADFVAPHLGTELFGNIGSIHAVANELRPYEEDQLSAQNAIVVVVGEGFADDGNLIENRDSSACLVLLLLDEAGKQHGLTICHLDRALNVAVCKRWRKIYGLAIRACADLLIDLEIDIAVGVNVRPETQNNARVLVGEELNTVLDVDVAEFNIFAEPVVIGTCWPT